MVRELNRPFSVHRGNLSVLRRMVMIYIDSERREIEFELINLELNWN
jgi:hypothetical protein